MIPRLYVAALGGLAVTVALLAGGKVAYNLGWEARDSQALREEALVQKVALASQASAADAISKMRVKHVTIRQELEKEIRENVVYRECVASERVLQLTNEAILGGAVAPGDLILPPTLPNELPNL
jgi:hypothetical protein